MIPCKAVVSSVLLIIVVDFAVQAKPHPSIIRERHVIHAPIKFRVIHHYKIKKIPIVIKKHLHYHKPEVGKVKPILEEFDANHIYHDDAKGFSGHLDFHQPDHNTDFPPHTDFHHHDDSQDFPPNLNFHQQDTAGYSSHQKDDSKGYPPHFGFHQQDESKGYSSHFGSHHQGDGKGYPPHREASPHDNAHEDQEDQEEDQEEDYEESQQSQEDYDDYEYE